MTRKTRIQTPAGWATLTLQDGVVWVTTARASLGGYRVDRFNGGAFGAEWARQWVAAATVQAVAS